MSKPHFNWKHIYSQSSGTVEEATEVFKAVFNGYLKKTYYNTPECDYKVLLKCKHKEYYDSRSS